MDLGLSSSSNVSSGSGPQVNRKERGAIAAQACETCRNRKQRCDEQRPKCGTCQRFKLECRYREPQPTKKDKTLVEILDRLKNVESKIDNLGLRDNATSPLLTNSRPSNVYSTNTSLLVDPETQGSLAGTSLSPTSPTPSIDTGGYRYDSSVSKMSEWPVMRQMFESLGQKPPSPLGEIPALPGGLRDSTITLPSDGVQPVGIPSNSAMQVPLHLSGSSSSTLNLSPPSIDWETMQRLSKSYFDVINILHPIMDRQWFNSNTLSSILSNGFQEGVISSLVLLVFALGEVALTTSEVPISAYKQRPSGIKGGTIDRPPGLAYFNEARKRMGFSLTEISLENVQMFALASVYYSSCGQALECWRMAVYASLACQALITSKPSELHGPRTDLVKRIFWHCSIMETCFNMEFGLPLTGLEKFEETMGLPDFSGPITDEDYICDQASHFHEHFASQIVLQRLSVNFHSVLNKVFGVDRSLSFPGFGPFNGSTSPGNAAVMKQLDAQLGQWRGMLPSHLRWQDIQDVAYSEPSHDAFGDVYTGQPLQSNRIFTPDLDTQPATYPFAADIHIALLRTRYSYNKYLIYRPCIFKALHHPESLTREDAEGAAECLKASLKWPITLSPPCTNKRLVPIAFFWSQNVFGILVLLHLSQQHPMLLRIRSSLCGQGFDVEAAQTVTVYLDWLRDMKKIDSTANWCWNIVRLVYRLDD
ncbi:related to acetate regulatory DNA binding protein FacB [Fusarium torulosum]|uniref:Related to acetate regulatory DNA binding protein FacB n=1 Tax=Fusarium torulosum TaxID=33205 RepID=A0AAE8SL59_9HYPO|nr:related to acetate regulatory DNA binding protein FacB [Fusarium torulosum]